MHLWCLYQHRIRRSVPHPTRRSILLLAPWRYICLWRVVKCEIYGLLLIPHRYVAKFILFVTSSIPPCKKSASTRVSNPILVIVNNINIIPPDMTTWDRLGGLSISGARFYVSAPFLKICLFQWSEGSLFSYCWTIAFKGLFLHLNIYLHEHFQVKRPLIKYWRHPIIKDKTSNRKVKVMALEQ